MGSESRRSRRKMERALGLKSTKGVFSREAIELRERKKRAGEEVHRQNLERAKNRKPTQEVKKKEKTEGISLNVDPIEDEPTIFLDNNPYKFLEDTNKEKEANQ